MAGSQIPSIVALLRLRIMMKHSKLIAISLLTSLLALACSDGVEPGTDGGAGSAGAAGSAGVAGSAGTPTDGGTSGAAGQDSGVEEDGGAPVEPTEPTFLYLGTYSTNFGGFEEYTATEILSGSDLSTLTNYADIEKVTEDGSSLFTSGPAYMEPSKTEYSYSEYKKVGDTVYYCTHIYGKETLAEAEASAKLIDPNLDPTMNTCGGLFSWTQLSLVTP